MKGYGQYCPIARASEIFAERWTPIIVRNIILGCRTFGAIEKGAPGISRTLLAQRLKLLERHGIVKRTPQRGARGSTYTMTEAGEGLWDVCVSLGTWGATWLEVAPEHLDPYVVLWSMSNSLDRDEIPARRLVLRFEFPDLRAKNRFWLLIEDGHGEVCLKHPGFDEDLIVRANSEWFAKWHMGWISWDEAKRKGISLEGPRDLVRAFPRWDKLSHFAGVKPVASARRLRPRTAV
jgi:DNA-binding HxlR family transcriptional regulator